MTFRALRRGILTFRTLFLKLEQIEKKLRENREAPSCLKFKLLAALAISRHQISIQQSWCAKVLFVVICSSVAYMTAGAVGFQMYVEEALDDIQAAHDKGEVFPGIPHHEVLPYDRVAVARNKSDGDGLV